MLADFRAVRAARVEFAALRRVDRAGNIALKDLDFAAALARYKEALAIYEKLEMPRGRAEALNQIGRVLRKAAVPQRTTRDLVFEEEEEVTFT